MVLSGFAVLCNAQIYTPPNLESGFPPPEMGGWFYDSSGPLLWPPADPWQIWASPESIAALNAWLQIQSTPLPDLSEVGSLGDLPSQTAGAASQLGAPEPESRPMACAVLLLLAIVGWLWGDRLKPGGRRSAPSRDGG